MSLIDFWAYLVLTEKSRTQPKQGAIKRRKMEAQRARQQREEALERRIARAIRMNERSMRRRGKPLFDDDLIKLRKCLGSKMADYYLEKVREYKEREE